MKTIRRIYLYLISAISIELVLWGSIQLLRSILQPDITGTNTQNLSIGIAQVVVSIPIFLIHWFIIQADVRKSDEERETIIRPIFLYGILLGTLIPVVQNLLAAVNRIFLVGTGSSRMTALVGQSQTSIDNAIAIVLNLVLAWYFWRILQADEFAAETDQNDVVVLRAYRYIWMLYGLGMTVLGMNQLILFLLSQSRTMMFESTSRLVNPIALLVIGTPIWVIASLQIKKSLERKEEEFSSWRIGILFGLIFLGAIGSLFAWMHILNWSFRLAMDYSINWDSFLLNTRSTIAIIIPTVTFWIYYHLQFEENLNHRNDVYSTFHFRRILHYPIALVSLATLIVGAVGLVNYLIDVYGMHTMSLGGAYSKIPLNAAALTVGLFFWVRFFLPENSISIRADEHGVDARRSMIRKTYLYIVVFGTIVGVMASAGMTLYQIFEGSLTGQLSNKAASIYKGLAQLVILGVFLWYHLGNLRRDSQLKASRLAEMHTNYPVLIAESVESAIGKELKLSFSRQIPAVPVEFLADPKQWSGEYQPRAIAISSVSRLDLDSGWTEKLRGYTGKIITFGTRDPNSIWTPLPESASAAAKSVTTIVRMLAEGRDVPIQKSLSVWLLLGYIFGGLFVIQILLVLMSAILRF